MKIMAWLTNIIIDAQIGHSLAASTIITP